MRIAFIAPQPFVDIRGTSMANLRLTEVLSELGHDVDVITYPFGTSPDLSGVSVHRCSRMPGVNSVRIGFSPAKLLMDLSLAWSALRVIRKSRYDCIQGVEEGVFIAMVLGRLTRTPVVYDMDSVMSYEISMSSLGKVPGIVRLMRSAERRAIRNSAFVMTICDSMAKYVRSISPAANVAVVPDIPPIPLSGGPDPERARAQLSPEFMNGRKLIVYTGSLAGYQGMDLLVSAMPAVMARHPEAALLVVGGDGKDIAHLSNIAHAAGVVDHIQFLGKRPPEQIPDFLALADILVSPRRGGINLPAKIYTYMQSGRPIVATSVPAHTAVLGWDTAMVINPTSAGIADGICWALDHPDRAQTRAMKAQEAVSTLTPEWQASRIQQAYDFLTTGPTVGSARSQYGTQ